MIIEKDGVFKTVQCKFTSSKDNTVKLKSCGGTNGAVYDSVLNHPVDLLFCADKDKNMYVIPVDDIRVAGNMNSIKLRNAPTINPNGMKTWEYIVSL